MGKYKSMRTAVDGKSEERGLIPSKGEKRGLRGRQGKRGIEGAKRTRAILVLSGPVNLEGARGWR